MNTAALAAVLTVAQFGPPPGWIQDGPVYTRASRLVPVVIVQQDVPIVPTFGQPSNYVRDITRPVLDYDDPDIPGNESSFYGSHWVAVPGRTDVVRQFAHTPWPN